MHEDEESECDRAGPESFDVRDKIPVDNKGTESGCLIYISTLQFQSCLHKAALITPNCS